jgi:hypothetical protein
MERASKTLREIHVLPQRRRDAKMVRNPQRLGVSAGNMVSVGVLG